MKTELRLLREKKGLSLRKLGKETGIHFTRAQRHETRREPLFPRDVERYCRVLDTEPDAIRGEDGLARTAKSED